MKTALDLYVDEPGAFEILESQVRAGLAAPEPNLDDESLFDGDLFTREDPFNKIGDYYARKDGDTVRVFVNAAKVVVSLEKRGRAAIGETLGKAVRTVDPTFSIYSDRREILDFPEPKEPPAFSGGRRVNIYPGSLIFPAGTALSFSLPAEAGERIAGTVTEYILAVGNFYANEF
ncbi:MAG: hypothetical protein V1820_06615 [archaeon]